MNGIETLLNPSECALLLVDLQAGLGYGVESMPRQVLINNATALAKTALRSACRLLRRPRPPRSTAAHCFRRSRRPSGGEIDRAPQHERVGG